MNLQPTRYKWAALPIELRWRSARSSTLRKLDDVLRNRALGRAGNLQLRLDRPQDFPRLGGDGISPVRQNVIVLQVGQGLPQNVLEATSRERPDDLDRCGASSAEDLFTHLPEAVRLNRPLDLAPGISEYEIVQYFRDRAAENASGYASFLGAGVYNHYRPVLVDTVVSRGEFLTSYTPYQAEISQGTLTTIFEFQTMICQLTGMDVANASMYDGSTAVPEAAMMAVRATGKGRVLVAKSVHPEYREVLRTYAKHQGMPVDEFGYLAAAGTIDLEDLERKMDDLTAAVMVQSPNFFGIVDQVKAE